MKSLLATIQILLALGISGIATGQTAERWYEVSGGAWRVPAPVVNEIRSRIEAAAREAVHRSVTKKIRSVAGDTVQYQGFIDQKTKRKQIQIYGMCRTEKSAAQLKDFWAFTHDGGNCYYWATYDPASKKFTSFEFNSAA